MLSYLFLSDANSSVRTCPTTWPTKTSFLLDSITISSLSLAPSLRENPRCSTIYSAQNLASCRRGRDVRPLRAYGYPRTSDRMERVEWWITYWSWMLKVPTDESVEKTRTLSARAHCSLWQRVRCLLSIFGSIKSVCTKAQTWAF